MNFSQKLLYNFFLIVGVALSMCNQKEFLIELELNGFCGILLKFSYGR